MNGGYPCNFLIAAEFNPPAGKVKGAIAARFSVKYLGPHG